MTFRQGQSGNPKGRPPKSRALTQILERAGAKKDQTTGIPRKRLLADMVWQLLTTGRVELPGGEVLEATPKDWLEATKFLYSHIDGPPKAELDVTSGGEKLRVILSWGEDADAGSDSAVAP